MMIFALLNVKAISIENIIFICGDFVSEKIRTRTYRKHHLMSNYVRTTKEKSLVMCLFESADNRTRRGFAQILSCNLEN